MRRALRGLLTRALYADPPCRRCGRPCHWPGALRADVCRAHWEQQAAAAGPG